MNFWQAAFHSGLNMIKNHKQLPPSIGGVLYDVIESQYPQFLYSDQENKILIIPLDVKANIWNWAVYEYRLRTTNYPLLNKSLDKNKTCINMYKGELIRYVINNNLELQKLLW